MFETIDTLLHEQCKLVKDRPVIVGVSGGPDSLCLLSVLHKAGYRAIAAHFDHTLRPDSGADADAVQQLASRLKIDMVVESGDVHGYAEREKLSMEEAARNLRYRFLMDQARRFKAQAVAVGHTADDQVETVLMHFLRGAGLAGLKGMTHRTVLPLFDPEIPIVRPLLDTWREETVVYCGVNGLRPRHDPSNASLDFFRNRLRHLLIPALEAYNPRFREVVWRTANSLGSDYEVLQVFLDDVWKQCVVQENADFVAFDSSALMGQPLGLQRNLLRRAMERIHPTPLDASFETVERAVRFIGNVTTQSARMDLIGNLHLLREGLLVYVVTGDSTLPVERWPQLPDHSPAIAMSVPGTAMLSGNWKMNCERWSIASLAVEQARSNTDPFQVWLDAKTLSGKLELRTRREGDRFEPLGMNGQVMKLSDFFINAKLPQRARDRWPLLCMGDTIVWIPGYRPAHPFRLTENTRQVLYFALMRG